MTEDTESGQDYPDYGMTLPNNVERQLQLEIASLRDHAARSTDPLLTAKAIAISHEGVQQEIRLRLADKFRLADIIVLPSDSATVREVFIRFLPDNKIGSISQEGMLVSVDLPDGDVAGVIRQFTLPMDIYSGRPFVFLNAERTSLSADRPADSLDRRAADFLARLGLGIGGGGLVVGTVVTSGIASTTYKASGPGGRYAPEDTGQESPGDACDEFFA